jgi:hypothetical protein
MVKLPKTSAIGLNISGFFGYAETLLQVFCGCTALENTRSDSSVAAMRYLAEFQPPRAFWALSRIAQESEE